MQSINKLSVEQNTAFFSDDSMKQLRNIMHMQHFPEDSLLYLEGDVMNKLFLVVEGYVKLSKLNEAGKNLIFHYFFPEDLFGEFNPQAQSAKSSFTAWAMEDTVLGVIHSEDFSQLLTENSRLTLEFAQWQSHLQNYAQMKLRDLLFHGKDGALASAILRTYNTYGQCRGDRMFITVKFTNNNFAEMIGTPRETVTRLLNAFKKEGIINYHNGWIEVLELDRLKELCACEDCPVSVCRL